LRFSSFPLPSILTRGFPGSYILLLVLTTSDLLACYLLVYGVVQQHSAYLLPFVCVNIVGIATLIFLVGWGFGMAWHTGRGAFAGATDVFADLLHDRRRRVLHRHVRFSVVLSPFVD
jgi:hypothetical protein